MFLIYRVQVTPTNLLKKRNNRLRKVSQV